MSAPPIAITISTPSTEAIAVLIRSALSAISGSPPTNTVPSQMTTSIAIALPTCRPGISSGFERITPWSLPNATTEPVNVNAPMKIAA
jgi:hypothetical protein